MYSSTTVQSLYRGWKRSSEVMLTMLTMMMPRRVGLRSRRSILSRSVGSHSVGVPSGRDKEKELKVDRSGLVNKIVKKGEGPLTKDMRAAIEKLGPMTVADYMHHCLQHPVHGYYTSQDSQIGRAGDFTTAPEISQLFGEAIGVWMVSVWAAMGAPAQFHLVEMGPGKGTLMLDILRTARSFPRFREAATVHLVETSPSLRSRQRSVLGCSSLPKPTTGSTAGSDATGTQAAPQLDSAMKINGLPAEEMSMVLPDGGLIHWHLNFHDVPAGPMLFVGQEILDAFPVHQFQMTAEGWRERLIEIAPPNPQGLPFRFTLSQHPTPAVAAFLDDGQSQKKKKKKKLDFSQSTWREEERKHIKNAGPSSADASEFEAAQEALGEASEAGGAGGLSGVGGLKAGGGALPGDEIEVCPMASALVQDVGLHLARHRGGALFVDYGAAHAHPNSLRAFSDHEITHVLQRPGEIDLTTDVDFASLRRVLKKTEGLSPIFVLLGM